MSILQSLRYVATYSALIAAFSLPPLINAAPAYAVLVWNWSFGGADGMSEQGTFTTTDGDTSSPDTIYEILDFGVTASNFGAPIGSNSDGTYTGPLNAGQPVQASFRFLSNSQSSSSFLATSVPLSGFQFDSGAGFSYSFENAFFAPELGMVGRLQNTEEELTNSFTSGNLASEPIPEPLTVIGTLIGGGAVWRMRQKLKEAAKVKAK